MFETNTDYRCRGKCLLETKLFITVGESVCLRQTLFMAVVEVFASDKHCLWL